MKDAPELCFSINAARTAIERAKRDGRITAVVPTMGALHEGHLSLVRAARKQCDFVAATIFVNPTQFGPHEDLARYPRTWESDVDGLTREGVDMIFAPAPDEIYPVGWSTWVEPPRVATTLEGEHRPGHFRGVATVVLKLFQILPVQHAFFGLKDYQQCLVIRDMVRDLNVAVELHFMPTVREPDGLAMSSRNRYLDAEQRQRALGIARALRRAQEAVAAGQWDISQLESQAADELHAAPFDEVDYCVVRHAETLEPLKRLDRPGVMLIAARMGLTRLIDNTRLEPPPNVVR